MENLFKEIELLGSEIPWLKEKRTAGRNAFLSQGIPTAKTEAWKYTKPNRFLGEEFLYNPRGKIDTPNGELSLPFTDYRICFENGVFNPFNSNLPQGIEILPLIEALILKSSVREKTGKLADINKHPFAALNQAYLNEGVFINIDSNVNITKPISIVYHVSCDVPNSLYNMRNVIVVGENASVELCEYFCYDGDVKSVYLTNVVNEIYILRNAKLNHYKAQNEAFKAGHIALNAVEVLTGGEYNSFCLQKGADMGRNESQIFLSEENAFAQVNAAYIMNGWATLDTTTDIRHIKPHTKSSQLIKGVVGGQAKGVFQGKIHIAPQAIKTEGYQLHKAMLLTDEAEVDVKPELEIFADDVKCSHGSACGQLDAEQLFYMRSRGINEETAKQLLIDAYLNDVIAKVDNENIANWIKLLIQDN